MGLRLSDSLGARFEGAARMLCVLAVAWGVAFAGTIAASDRASAEQPLIVIQPAASDGFDDETGLHDPLEGVNRVIFAFNDTLDQVVLRPVALIYRTVLPRPLRKGVANFINHTRTPVTFANDVLQGNMKRAETTMVRFFLNSVAGFGGLYDIAAEAGWEYHSEDFGQTLATYGVPSGPYIMAPILGPSTPRHLVGRAVDILANPWTWILWDASTIESMSPTLGETISARDEALDALDAAREGSPDFYVTIKSLYHQNRQSEINNGAVLTEDLPDIPDLR